MNEKQELDGEELFIQEGINGGIFLQCIKFKKDESYILNFDGENLIECKNADEALIYLAKQWAKERENCHNLFCKIERTLNEWDKEITE